MSLNLEQQLKFYGAYHHHPVNIWIHVACVPLLLVTGLLFATNSPSVPLPAWLTVPNLPLNLGTAACLAYSALYILMEPVAGAMLAPLLLGAVAFGNHLTQSPNPSTVHNANYIALAVHIVSWLSQFIGHGIFEGRAPALLDNLVQAIFLAPFFVWLEILFAFGYRPELKSRLDASVAKEVDKFRAEKRKKDQVGANGHASPVST